MDLEAMFDSHSKRKKTNSLNKIVKQINIEFFQYQMFLTGKSSKQVEEFFHNATDRLRKEAEAYIRTGYDEEDALKIVKNPRVIIGHMRENVIQIVQWQMLWKMMTQVNILVKIQNQLLLKDALVL